jgi:hypothetical protein
VVLAASLDNMNMRTLAIFNNIHSYGKAIYHDNRRHHHNLGR